MFHWICPECGREIPPAMKECAVCDGQAEEGAAGQEGVMGQGPEASKNEVVNGRSPATSETQDEAATVIRADERVDDQKPAAKGARGQRPKASKNEVAGGEPPVASENKPDAATVIGAHERVGDQKPATEVAAEASKI